MNTLTSSASPKISQSKQAREGFVEIDGRLIDERTDDGTTRVTKLVDGRTVVIIEKSVDGKIVVETTVIETDRHASSSDNQAREGSVISFDVNGLSSDELATRRHVARQLAVLRYELEFARKRNSELTEKRKSENYHPLSADMEQLRQSLRRRVNNSMVINDVKLTSALRKRRNEDDRWFNRLFGEREYVFGRYEDRIVHEETVGKACPGCKICKGHGCKISKRDIRDIILHFPRVMSLLQESEEFCKFTRQKYDVVFAKDFAEENARRAIHRQPARRCIEDQQIIDLENEISSCEDVREKLRLIDLLHEMQIELAGEDFMTKEVNGFKYSRSQEMEDALDDLDRAKQYHILTSRTMKTMTDFVRLIRNRLVTSKEGKKFSQKYHEYLRNKLDAKCLRNARTVIEHFERRVDVRDHKTAMQQTFGLDPIDNGIDCAEMNLRYSEFSVEDSLRLRRELAGSGNVCTDIMELYSPVPKAHERGIMFSMSAPHTRESLVNEKEAEVSTPGNRSSRLYGRWTNAYSVKCGDYESVYWGSDDTRAAQKKEEEKAMDAEKKAYADALAVIEKAELDAMIAEKACDDENLSLSHADRIEREQARVALRTERSQERALVTAARDKARAAAMAVRNAARAATREKELEFGVAGAREIAEAEAMAEEKACDDANPTLTSLDRAVRDILRVKAKEARDQKRLATKTEHELTFKKADVNWHINGIKDSWTRKMAEIVRNARWTVARLDGESFREMEDPSRCVDSELMANPQFKNEYDAIVITTDVLFKGHEFQRLLEIMCSDKMAQKCNQALTVPDPSPKSRALFESGTDDVDCLGSFVRLCMSYGLINDDEEIVDYFPDVHDDIKREFADVERDPVDVAKEIDAVMRDIADAERDYDAMFTTGAANSSSSGVVASVSEIDDIASEVGESNATSSKKKDDVVTSSESGLTSVLHTLTGGLFRSSKVHPV